MFQFTAKTLKTAVFGALIGTSLLPVSAQAGVTSSQGRNVVYKTTFNDMNGTESTILDWKNQSAEFTFDMEDADWTDGLELFLSADPIGRVSSRTPVMVQFNNGKPVPVVTRGQGFDTRIKLDKSKIRPRRNKVKFTYKTPSGETCLLPDHGGWRLDFKESFVVVKARAKSRNYYLREVESRLSNATTAPATISVLARGQNTAKLQALAAQGVGMRMKKLPEFRTTKSNAEFEIVLGRRDELYSWVTDKKVLDGTGPKIQVHEGRPMRLVITGDTDAEVMATASAFATRTLPSTQRTKTSLGEVQFQSPFKASQKIIEGSTKIADLGGTYFDGGWGPKAKEITFNVKDPSVSQGAVTLRLASNKNVNKDSRVSVNLNGQSLGYTTLNKNRKTVAFDIPEGTLNGSDNVLTITPELELSNVSGCNYKEDLPGFRLGAGSKIEINTPRPSPVAELSKMTATGAPFSIEQGSDTLIVLPAGSSRDYAASLKILAKLAKTSGGGLVNADYMRSTNYASMDHDKNILYIGSSRAFKGSLRNAAPKGLSTALKGQTLRGTDAIALNDRYASSNEADTMRLYAARQLRAGRIGKGGVAAIYPSPLSSGKVVGVITNVPGSSFSVMANQIVKPTHWNALQGSVSRWNKSNILMAQTAINVPGFELPKPTFSGFGNMSSGLSFPNFELPDFDMPSFEFLTLEDFDADMAKARLGNFSNTLKTKLGHLKDDTSQTLKATTPKPQSSIAYVAPATKTIEIGVPKLRRSILDTSNETKLELRGFSDPQTVLGQSSIIDGAASWMSVKSDKLKSWWQNRGHSIAASTSGPSTSAAAPRKAPRFTMPQLIKDDDKNQSLWLILILGSLFALMALALPESKENTVRSQNRLRPR